MVRCSAVLMCPLNG